MEDGGDSVEDLVGYFLFGHEGEVFYLVVGLDEEDFVGVGAEAAAFGGYVVGDYEVEVFFGDFGLGVLEEVVAFGGEAYARPPRPLRRRSLLLDKRAVGLLAD